MGHCVRHISGEIAEGLFGSAGSDTLPAVFPAPKLSARRLVAHLDQARDFADFLSSPSSRTHASSSTALPTAFPCSRLSMSGPSQHCCQVADDQGETGSACVDSFGKCPRDLKEVGTREQLKHPRSYCARAPNHVVKCTLSRKMKTSSQIEKIEGKCDNGFHGFMGMCGKKLEAGALKKSSEAMMAVCCHRSEGLGLTGVTCELKEMPHGAEKMTQRFREGLKTVFSDPCPPQVQYKLTKRGQKLASTIGQKLSAATQGVSQVIGEFLKKLLQLEEYYMDNYFVLDPRAFMGAFIGGPSRHPQVRCISNSLVAKVLQMGKKLPGVTVTKEDFALAMSKGSQAKEAQKAAMKKVLRQFPTMFKKATLTELHDKIANHPTPFDKMSGPGKIKRAIDKFRMLSADVMYKFFDKVLSFEKARRIKGIVTKDDPDCPPEWQGLPTHKRLYLFIRGEFDKTGKEAVNEAVEEATKTAGPGGPSSPPTDNGTGTPIEGPTGPSGTEHDTSTPSPEPTDPDGGSPKRP
mmetsp:Transcript_17784/g.41438  ORF Transcript_17784/g.41438 Transcript_17784/m.41438 type:complete len:520 (-) Transcript_17784:53-1612(-)